MEKGKIYINTKFIISNNQKEYPLEQIWVSFVGRFTDTHHEQTIGTQPITDFKSTWRSFSLSDLQVLVTDIGCVANTYQYMFSLNGFSGRIYINYGQTPLSSAPNPGAPGKSPYIVFELTVDGLTNNMDLSYVDGISAQAATMVRNSTTGFALHATSVNPVTATNDIMTSVANLVPTDAQIKNGTTLTRIMSSAASPSSYHNWTKLMKELRASTQTTPLKVCSYTAPTTGLPDSYALNGSLFGYSGAPALPGQVPGFDKMQDYTMNATFVDDLNPTNNQKLTDAGIAQGTAGVKITGSATEVTKRFSIYITEDTLNAGTGIYGNNPGYVVLHPITGDNQTAYSTPGIANDLGGRIVGDLMAGMVFGWSASDVDIETHANNTQTSLYTTPFSSKKMHEISTGELFFLLSLAGSEGKLKDWIGPNLDSNADNYDPYLYAIAINSEAYGSGFTDRLQGYSNPDTYWYTANPPAIPGGKGHFETVGFVNLFLGSCTTAAMHIRLKNTGNKPLALKTSRIQDSSSMTELKLPKTVAANSTTPKIIVPASKTPYALSWTYSPHGDSTTSLTFDCSLSGPEGINVIPEVNSQAWRLSEAPTWKDGVWIITFIYEEAQPALQ